MSLDPPRRFDPDEPLVLDPDPVSQWLDWEEQANLVGFRTSTAPVAIDVVRVPRRPDCRGCGDRNDSTTLNR